jgi:O-antigen/teichoic acid export membrane protein
MTEDTNAKNKYLFKNTAIFALGNIATKLISFFLIPLYTYKLTTSQYGTADLLLAVCSFIYPLITLNIAEAIFRFSMDKNADSDKISRIGFKCFYLSVLLALPIAFLLELNKDTAGLGFFVYLYIVSSSSSQILLALMKGQEKLGIYTIGNILNTLLTTIFSLVFLLIFNMKLDGFFAAYVISNTIVTAYIVIESKIYKVKDKTKTDAQLFKQMAKYSTVLIPTTFMWWIVNSSDKLMITSFISASANGIYAISYKIPSLLTVIASIFNQAWVFSAVKQKDDSSNTKYTNDVFDMLYGSIAVVAVVLLAFIKIILKYAVASEYYESWIYTPFLIFGFIFMTMSTFISTSYNAHKDSKGLLFSGMVGAITNIVLNAIFIPLFGVIGAALATVISYISVFTYRHIDTKKYVKIYIKPKYAMTLLVVLAACITVYTPKEIAIFAHAAEIVAIVILNKKCFEGFLKLIKNKLKKD